MEREWYLDGNKVRFGEIIRLAKEYGYHESSGIYQTSRAVPYLRDNGHEVDYKFAEETSITTPLQKKESNK